jgi:acetolactate synthase small subunit
MKKRHINESELKFFQAVARFTHTEDITVQKLGEQLRGVEDVITIVQLDHNFDLKQAIMKVKVMSRGTKKDAYSLFRMRALKKVAQLKKVEIASNTVKTL